MFRIFLKHPKLVSSDLCFHNLFLKMTKAYIMKRLNQKIKLHNHKDADRTAEGCNINSQNQRPQLAVPVVTVQVIKIHSNI